MPVQQRIVPIRCSLTNPGFRSLQRLHPDVCLGIGKIRIEIHLIISIGRYNEHHFVSIFHMNGTVLIGPGLTTFCNRLHTDSIFHPVIIQSGRIAEFPLLFPDILACRYRIRQIREYQVLPTHLGRLETDNHYIVRIRDKIGTAIPHSIGYKIHMDQRRIKRKCSAVTGHLGISQSGCYTKLTTGGETTEPGRIFVSRSIRHRTVKIVLGQFCRLFRVTIRKSLPDILQDMSRLFVHIPIISRTF